MNSIARCRRVALSEDFAGCGVERSKQVSRSMANVVVGLSFWLAQTHRQDRLSTLERLNLRFLVNAQHDRVVRRVHIQLETTPKGRTHWSTRSMAKHLGLSHSTIGRIWRTFGLQPHRSESFRLSQDPQLVEKVRDVVGLVLVTTSSIWSSVIVRSTPGLGSSYRPSNRCSTKRLRHLPTVLLMVRSFLATSEFVSPDAHCSTILARNAWCGDARLRRVSRSSALVSSEVSFNSANCRPLWHRIPDARALS